MRYLTDEEASDAGMLLYSKLGYDLVSLLNSSQLQNYLKALTASCRMVMCDDNGEICNLDVIPFVKFSDYLTNPLVK